MKYQITIDTERGNDLDRIVHEAVEAVCLDITDEGGTTVRRFCERLGVSYRVASRLIAGLGLRDRFRKYERKAK